MFFFVVFGKFGMRISIDAEENITDAEIISSVSKLTGFPVDSLKRITEQEYWERFEDAENNRDWEED